MTVTLNDVRATIEAQIQVELAKAPSYPVAFQNSAFKPPNNKPWVQIFIRFESSSYATLLPPGLGFNEQAGVLSINVFTPAGAGAGANYTIAERIKALFDRQTIAKVKFDPAVGPQTVSANVLETGTSASGALAAAYYQTQMTITFDAYLD